MKRRPESVDAHIELVSPGHLSTWETMLPTPSVRSRSPQYELVRSPLPPPSWTQSPHAGSSPGVVNSGQFASRYDWLPPLSCVPPIRCFAFVGSTDRVENWSVERPLFELWRCDGTLESRL